MRSGQEYPLKAKIMVRACDIARNKERCSSEMFIDKATGGGWCPGTYNQTDWMGEGDFTIRGKKYKPSFVKDVGKVVYSPEEALSFVLVVDSKKIENDLTKILSNIKQACRDIQKSHPLAPCRLVILNYSIPTQNHEKSLDITNLLLNLNEELKDLKCSFLSMHNEKEVCSFARDSIEEIVEEASASARLLDWRQSSKYKNEHAELVQIWNNPNYSTDEARIIACLNHYTRYDCWLYRMFSGCWDRNHVDRVAQICTNSGSKTAQNLFDELNKISLRNLEGSCAIMKDFIGHKLKNNAPEEDVELECSNPELTSI